MKSTSHLGEIREGILIAEAFSATFERHFTVAEVAVMWNLSEDAVRRLFRNEPGVLHLSRAAKGKTRRRPYTTLRIPQSVVERVHKRCSLVK